MVQSYSKVKFFAVMVILTAFFAFSAGCTGETGQDSGVDKIPAETASPAELPEMGKTAEITTAPTETPAALPDTDSDTFSGTGSKKTEMPLDEGVNLLTFEQNEPSESLIIIDGKSSHFEIQNTFPADRSVYVNEYGKYISSQVFTVIDGGNTEVSVETDSEWKLSFSFPQMTDGIPPQIFEGAGNQATPFFRIDKGEYNFRIKTENNTFVYIVLTDYDGNELHKDFSEGFDAVPLPYHEGEYDGTVTANIEESSNYLFNVNCDGKWMISVEKA